MSVEAELPARVYWHRGCYQYKSTELDRASGMKSWVHLGSTISEAIASYRSLDRVIQEPQRLNHPGDPEMVVVLRVPPPCRVEEEQLVAVRGRKEATSGGV